MRLLEIPGRKAHVRLAGQLGEDRRIARVLEVGVAAPQLSHEARDVGELLGPFDLRMRSEHLLDQRRARAGEPDDEDRLVAYDAIACARREELPRTHLLLVRRVPLDRFRPVAALGALERDRKSTRLNSSHLVISYAVFCLKKKNKNTT